MHKSSQNEQKFAKTRLVKMQNRLIYHVRFNHDWLLRKINCMLGNDSLIRAPRTEPALAQWGSPPAPGTHLALLADETVYRSSSRQVGSCVGGVAILSMAKNNGHEVIFSSPRYIGAGNSLASDQIPKRVSFHPIKGFFQASSTHFGKGSQWIKSLVLEVSGDRQNQSFCQRGMLFQNL